MSGIILTFKNLRLRVGAFMLLLLSVLTSLAQSENVGIGTTKPDNSALLDLTSTSKGLLIPRMTLAQRAGIKSPATGLMVYQLDFFTGFYFFDGEVWRGLYARSIDGAAFNSDPVTPVPTTTSVGWNIGGNSGLNSEVNFLGTVDTTSLAFKVNNYRSGLIDFRFGNTYFGYRAGYRSQGYNSIAIGAYALHDSNIGLNNIAIGYQSLLRNQTGSDNVAFGANSLYTNISGSQNVSVGTQAGLRSVGDGNVFIGYKAGMNESGNNKLYIDNNSQKAALIYGDFEKARVGINTQSPGSALSIDSKIVNLSGLEFKQLNSDSPAEKPTLKVLSVDKQGRVILVRDSIGTSSPSFWGLNGSTLSNTNAGKVTLNGLIQLGNVKASNTAFRPNGKVLSVDDNGNIILVRDSVATAGTIPVSSSSWNINGDNIANGNNGAVYINNSLILSKLNSDSSVTKSAQKFLTVDNKGNVILANVTAPTSTTAIAASDWALDGTNISNKNTGGVYINNGLWAKNGFRLQSGTLELNSAEENKSGLQFAQLKASNPAAKGYGKVLSVDDNGNVILVKDSVGVATSTAPVVPSQWTTSGTTIVNSNTGRVIINNGLTLPFTSEAITPISTQKFLTVDNAGNVILGNVPNSTPSSWTISGNDIVNSNLGKAYISNGLSVKSGINIESGNLVTNGSLTNRSGLVLNQLKLSFPASRPSGKVLSVDDNGNVILVRDSVGVAGTILDIPASWTVSADNISNANTGTVSIKSLTLPNLSSNNTPTVSTQKVLSVDANGNVILVNTPTTTVGTTQKVELWKTDTTGAILNNNTQGVVITANADGMSGLQFSKLKASSAAGNRYGKVLSVDDNGNVILVKDSVVTVNTIPVRPSPWNINGDNIANSNNGTVYINNSLILSKLSSDSAVTASAQKFLTVDNKGNVILANVPPSTDTTHTSDWTLDGANISNKNTGGVYINNGLWAKNGLRLQSGTLELNSAVENKSGLQFAQLKTSNPASKPSGKVLSVDDDGNVILVRDSVAAAVVNTPSSWTVSADNISNANTGSVSINSLTLPKISSNNTPTVTTQKVLSVDTNGNVILVNTPTTNTIATPTVELWKTDTSGVILNNNTQGVVITTKTDGKSGLQFAKLKAASPAGDRYGKVLSVDDNGNVILVNDGVTNGGNNTGAGWAITDGRLQNSNNGKVVIGTGINSFPGDFQLYVKGGILTERVRVAVANSDRWADYVFENGYKLMPLRDVEKHIDYYHHLPNVPSAEQIVKSGMDIMETSAKLLEKIEELTLYMIKANKQIELLEAKVNNLEKVQK